MKRSLSVAITILALTGTAAAAPRASTSEVFLSQPAAAQSLSDQIRGAVGAVRDTADTTGTTGVEAAAFAAIESVIVESGGDPVFVLAALRTASAEEGCRLQADGAWSVVGCAAMAQMSDLVQTALGGPAAGRETGATAGVAGGAPPSTSVGSDYTGN